MVSLTLLAKIDAWEIRGILTERVGITMNRPSKKVSHTSRVAKSALGVATLAMATGGVLASAAGASTLSSAPTHAKTTCAIAGDECSMAIAYANAHDGGGARVLSVEADTETYGGAQHRVFDIRMQANGGVYVVHVLRNDNAPYSDAVSQKRAENQNPSVGLTNTPSSNTGGSSIDKSPGVSTGTNVHVPSSSQSSQQITASQAAIDATNFATGRGYQVLGVKKERLNSKGQKDYYQVKLQLGQNGRSHGTMNIWIDATSPAGTVTAASGSGLRYRDLNLALPTIVQANALAATGGKGSVYKTSGLQGGKWSWYWVFVRSGSTKYKVGVDAFTGLVTQVRQN